MDKYEFNIKVEQIKKLVGKGDYETAMKIADTIDWRRVRNANLLSMVAMVYEKNEDYEEAREILLLAFERAPIGKRLLYKLAELALKEGNIDEAEAYYREFGDLAGDDPRQQLLRYMILKAKGAPAQQLIHSLESYTSQEIDEKWLYELAELYSLAGMADRCVEACDRIMLMFGLGKYVDKAMELKIQYAPLTTYQMDLVENRDKYEARLRAVEQGYDISKVQTYAPGQAEGYYEEDNPQMYVPDEPDPAVRMQEAAVQEGLAREMSRMAYEEPSAGRPMQPQTPDNIAGNNRGTMQNPRYAGVLKAAGESAAAGEEDASFQEAGGEAAFGAQVFNVNTPSNNEIPASVMPRPRKMPRMPESLAEYPSEPVIEEDYDEDGGLEQQICDATDNANDWEKGEYDSPIHENCIYEEGGMPYGSPSSKQPVYEEAAYEESVYEEPAYEGPVYEKPAYEELAHEGPVYEKPAYEELAHEGPVYEKPAYEELAHEASVYEKPIYENAEQAASGDAVCDEPGRGELDVDYRDADNFAYPQSEAGHDAPKTGGAEILPEGTNRIEDEDLEIEELIESGSNFFNHLMIEARTPERGLEIAVLALKQIHKEIGSKNPVAKITGEKLSKRGLLASSEKLSGKDLIIEEAGDLSQKALEELYELLRRDDGKMVVVMIDNPKQMGGLRRSHPRLADMFECIENGEECIGEENISEESSLPEQNKAIKEKEEAADSEVIPINREVKRNQAVRRPAHAVPKAVKEPSQEPVYEGEPYGREADVGDCASENAYETDFHNDQAIGGRDAGRPQKEKKSLFHRRKDPVYEEENQEEAYEDDDYYIEDTEETSPYRSEDAPGSHGEEMDIDEFAQYACRYANEIDCNITGKSMLALYERIEIMEEDGISLTRESAESLIEEAADRAEKPPFGKRMKGVFSSKYDKDGLLILKEDSFIY